MGDTPPVKEAPVTQVFKFSDDEAGIIWANKPRPRGPSPEEAARSFLKAAKFVPRKRNPKFENAFKSPPAGNPLFRPDPPFGGPSPARADSPKVLHLTEGERGPGRLITVGRVVPTEKGEDLFATRYQNVIDKYCEKVHLDGALGDGYGLRIKRGVTGSTLASVKEALRRRGFGAPVAVHNRKTGDVVYHAYVQQTVYERAIAGFRRSNKSEGSHQEPIVYETGGTVTVSTDDPAAGRIARFDDLHPEGDRFDPETARMLTVLDRGVKELTSVQFVPPGEEVAVGRVAEPETPRPPRTDMNLSDAEARGRLQVVLGEHSQEGSFFSHEGEQISYRIPKDDTALKILDFFGYQKTHVSYPHLKEVYVLPQHVAAARQTLIDHAKLLAEKRQLPEGVDCYLTSDEETTKVLKTLGYQRVLHDTGNGDEYVYMKPADYARVRKSDIPGTRRVVANGVVIGYEVTHGDAFDAMLEKHPGYDPIDINGRMYFAPARNKEALFAAVRDNPTPSPRAFGK